MAVKEQQIVPSYRAKMFTCPHCGLCAAQTWGKVSFSEETGETGTPAEGSEVAKCGNCGGLTLWQEQKLTLPPPPFGSPPHPSLSPQCCEWYEQARAVAMYSPRAACALLRGVICGMTTSGEKRYRSVERTLASMAKFGVIPRSLQKKLHRLGATGTTSYPSSAISHTDDRASMEALFEATAQLLEHIEAAKKMDEEVVETEETTEKPESASAQSEGKTTG